MQKHLSSSIAGRTTDKMSVVQYRACLNLKLSRCSHFSMLLQNVLSFLFSLKASLAQVQPLHKPPAQHHTTLLQSQKPSMIGPQNAYLSAASSHAGVCSTFIILAFFRRKKMRSKGSHQAAAKMARCMGPFFVFL